MLELHARQGGDAEFSERFVACFVAAVDDAGLPEEAEFRAAMRAYIEWAVDEVMSYAPHEAEVPAGLRYPAGPGTASSPDPRRRINPAPAVRST